MEKYLRECLDSILCQSFRDFECLLIDDGSKDNSGKICDEYAAKDNRITVFHTENYGLSHARNIGLDHINGEYVWFVDSDDFIADNALEIIHKELIENDLDLLQFSYDRVKDNDDIIDSSKKISTEVMDNSEYIRQRIFVISVWSKVLKADIIKTSHLLFIDDLRFAEDQMFTPVAITYCNRIKTISDVLYFYRWNDESLTQKCPKSRFINAMNNLLKLDKEYPVYKNHINNQLFADTTVILTTTKVKYKEVKNILAHFREDSFTSPGGFNRVFFFILNISPRLAFLTMKYIGRVYLKAVNPDKKHWVNIMDNTN